MALQVPSCLSGTDALWLALYSHALVVVDTPQLLKATPALALFAGRRSSAMRALESAGVTVDVSGNADGTAAAPVLKRVASNTSTTSGKSTYTACQCTRA